jgi:hypothetical protein
MPVADNIEKLEQSKWASDMVWLKKCPLGNDTIQSNKSQPTFQSNILPPSIGEEWANQETSMKQSGGRQHVPPKHQLTFKDYIALYPRRQTLNNHCCKNLKSYMVWLFGKSGWPCLGNHNGLILSYWLCLPVLSLHILQLTICSQIVQNLSYKLSFTLS